MKLLLKKDCMIGALGGVWTPGKLGTQKSCITLHKHSYLKVAVWACIEDLYNLGYGLGFPCVQGSDSCAVFLHGVLFATIALGYISLGRIISRKTHLM